MGRVIDLFSRATRPDPVKPEPGALSVSRGGLTVTVAEENDTEWVEQFLDEGLGEFHQEVAVLMASTTKTEVLDAIETIRRTVASWPGA